MFKKTLLPAVLLMLAIAVPVTGCYTVGPVKNIQQLQSATEDMQRPIEAKLKDLDSGLAEAAVKMSQTGLTGDGARAILEDLCVRYPYLVDTAAQDNDGTMVTLAPASARQYEGVNTGKNEVSTEFFANAKPLLSNMFTAAQGYRALVLVRPVGWPDGRLMGSISGLFRPEAFFDEIIAPRAKAGGLKVNVMQLDGMVMYCSTGQETGKNVLTDPAYKDYPALIDQARKIAAAKSGTGGYVFPGTGGKDLHKSVYWNTIGLYSTEWRLVSISELGD